MPHQATTRIFDAVARKLGLPDSLLVRTIEEFGNSSAATIALSRLIAHRERPFAPGERVLLTTAGAGLTGGAVVIGC